MALRISAALVVATMFAAAQSGCAPAPASDQKPPPPTVSVAVPLERKVTDYVDFTGRIEAPSSVDIRPRVTGYLVQMPFVEGAEVKKGDLLFEIDPRPYQAQLDQAQGDVGLNEAKLKLAKADNARAKEIAKANVGAISKQDLDKFQAAEEEALAAVVASKANLEQYKINLEFTKVTSPIDGRVGRYNLTIGNLVNADQTLLTTVVSQDPMYVYYDVDELTLINFMRRMIAANVDPLTVKKFPVYMGLADEDGYPHEGYVNFANNVVNASTGTITVRGVFENPNSPSGRRLLKPGMFVKVRFPSGEPHPALLVSEKAVGTDQGRKYLLVVNEKNVVEYRPVKTGPLQDDGLRVIREGLELNQRVVVAGLQLVRPKMEVVPTTISMPVVPISGDAVGDLAPWPTAAPSATAASTASAPAAGAAPAAAPAATGPASGAPSSPAPAATAPPTP